MPYYQHIHIEPDIALADRIFYNDYNTRLTSFTLAPLTLRQKKGQLANSGFFYFGFLDHVRCFYCLLQASGWHSTDVPAVIHSTGSPFCNIASQYSYNLTLQAMLLAQRTSETSISYFQAAARLRHYHKFPYADKADIETDLDSINHWKHHTSTHFKITFAQSILQLKSMSSDTKKIELQVVGVPDSPLLWFIRSAQIKFWSQLGALKRAPVESKLRKRWEKLSPVVKHKFILLSRVDHKRHYARMIENEMGKKGLIIGMDHKCMHNISIFSDPPPTRLILVSSFLSRQINRSLLEDM